MTEKILHLTLKRKYFDEISSGKKKKEYRDFKEYWIKRLMIPKVNRPIHLSDFRIKDFDYVIFRNGYGKNVPEMKIECLGISVLYDAKFVIHLGGIIYIKNNK